MSRLVSFYERLMEAKSHQMEQQKQRDLGIVAAKQFDKKNAWKGQVLTGALGAGTGLIASLDQGKKVKAGMALAGALIGAGAAKAKQAKEMSQSLYRNGPNTEQEVKDKWDQKLKDQREKEKKAKRDGDGDGILNESVVDSFRRAVDRVKSAIVPKRDTRTATEGFDNALATFRKHVSTPIPARVLKAWRDDLQPSDSYNDGHDGFFDVFNMWVDSDPEGRAWKVKNDKTGKQFLF